MDIMFYNCSKLISIDLSKFNTSKVDNMERMFTNCINLKYLDISNFNFSNIKNTISMLYNCSSLIFLNLSLDLKYCTYDEFTKNFLPKISEISDCSYKCFNKNLKLNLINNICIESCIQYGYQYELNNVCYSKCLKASYLKYCEIDEYNSEEVKKCFELTPEGYYLDLNNKIYKKCFKNCKYCYGE